MQQRFADSIRQYAQAAQRVVHNRESGRNLSIEEYISTRRGFSGGEVFY